MYLKYLKYVLRHKWYVLIECWRVGLIWRGIMHDMSKFRPDEFIPYARYFYGSYDPWDRLKIRAPWIGYEHSKEGVEEAFDRAWLLHQHRNPHHWQYWILRGDDAWTKVLLMDPAYLLEMICDWHGAGMAINGKKNTRAWYLHNREKMRLHPETRKTIEILLEAE